MVGGGDGMGKLYDIAVEINDSGIPCQLTIITGRNTRLRSVMETINWKIPVHIYGFARNMNELMQASDILLSKAGSLTISEACVMGLPLLLYEALAGQEEGNLQYIIDGQAGLYTPSTQTILRRLKEFLVDDVGKLEFYAANAKKLGKPDAVWDIADKIWQQMSDLR